jgi:hypothetical protein
MCLRHAARSAVGKTRRAHCALCHGQSVATVMDLPSSRELELEALLRKKDSQLADLTVCPLVWHPFVFTNNPSVVDRRMRSTPSGSTSPLNPTPLSPSLCLCPPLSYPSS